MLASFDFIIQLLLDRVIVSSGLTTSKRVEIQKYRVILTEPLEQYVRSVSVEYFFNRLRNKANSINVLKTTLFDFFFYSNELNRPKKDSLKKEWISWLIYFLTPPVRKMNVFFILLFFSLFAQLGWRSIVCKKLNDTSFVIRM